MKCNLVTEKFLELENYNKLPLKIHFHMLFCSSCKKEITKSQQFFASLINSTPFEMSEDRSDEIMNHISRWEANSEKYISPFNWVAIGCLIVVGMLIISYSDVITWFDSYFGGDLEIAMHLVMGFILSAYIAIFISIYQEKFKKIIGYPNENGN